MSLLENSETTGNLAKGEGRSLGEGAGRETHDWCAAKLTPLWGFKSTPEAVGFRVISKNCTVVPVPLVRSRNSHT